MRKNPRKHLLAGLVIIAMSVMTLSLSAGPATAPAWTLKDANGYGVSLSDYQGKPLILHFWATWCPYCKKLQPGLERLYRKYKEDGLEVLGISWWEDEGALPQKVLEDRGYTFKTLVDGDAVANQYGVKGTPTTFFINKEGLVVWMTNGSDPDDPKLEEVVRGMLGD